MSVLFNHNLLGYESYICGKDAFLLSEIRPLPSFFRVHWRVLEIDGFHNRLHFNFMPVKYTWTVGATNEQS